MTDTLNRMTTLGLVLIIVALVWKLYRVKEAPVIVVQNSPETEAIAEHLGAIESQLDEQSKLRRDKRLGSK